MHEHHASHAGATHAWTCIVPRIAWVTAAELETKQGSWLFSFVIPQHVQQASTHTHLTAADPSSLPISGAQRSHTCSHARTGLHGAHRDHLSLELQSAAAAGLQQEGPVGLALHLGPRQAAYVRQPDLCDDVQRTKDRRLQGSGFGVPMLRM